jgi:hypothetical protein
MSFLVGAFKVTFHDNVVGTWSEIVVSVESLGMDETRLRDYLERERLEDYSLRDRKVLKIERVQDEAIEHGPSSANG